MTDTTNGYNKSQNMCHSFIKYNTCAVSKWDKYLIREFQPSKVKNKLYLTKHVVQVNRIPIPKTSKLIYN